jgi:hypothetical protein
MIELGNHLKNILVENTDGTVDTEWEMMVDMICEMKVNDVLVLPKHNWLITEALHLIYGVL